VRDLADALHAYLAHHDRVGGDDYFAAERRRLRMRLDDALEPVSPGDDTKLLAIGRVQGLREAAGICDDLMVRNDWRMGEELAANDCVAAITAAAEKAERG
jgi:hypothetical protein